jgi:hypothetical protein
MTIKFMVVDPQGIIYTVRGKKKDAESWAMNYLEKHEEDEAAPKYLEIREIVQGSWHPKRAIAHDSQKNSAL